MKRSILVLAMAAVVLSAGETTNGDMAYYLTDLGTLGGNSSYAYSISNSGRAVGYGYPVSGPIAAIEFDVGGGGNNVRLSAYYSCARSVNSTGQIVGYGSTGSGSMKPLLFDPTGKGNNTVLANFSGVYGGAAYSINDSGQIVGASGNGTNSSAWLFDITGKGNNVYLGQGSANSISGNGLIAGSSHPVAGDGWHATLFDPSGNGNNIDLGKLLVGDDRSFAHSINNNGQIVGNSGGPYSGYTAVLYDSTGSGNNVALGAAGNSRARSINNAGQIVGEELGFATLFNVTGGSNTNLNDLVDPALGWTLTDARSINDYGWIVGNGINPDGKDHAFLLTPVPAPGAFLLGSIGLGMTCLKLRRREES